jgi:hypothetical protein
MAETIFGVETPATTDAADGVSYTMGTRFTVAVAGTATHGRWFFPTNTPSATIPVEMGIFRNTDQALLGSVQFGLLPTLGAWNQVAFSSPIALATGIEYTIYFWTPLRYVASSPYAWPKTSGNLTTASTVAGRFAESPGGRVFPTNSFNNGNYFADLVFEPGGTTQNGTAALSAASSMSITAVATRIAGAVALSAASSLSATAVRQQPATAGLSAASGLAAGIVTVSPAPIILSAASGLSATAVRQQPGAAALSAASTMTAAAVRQQPATASLSAASGLSTTAIQTAAGTVTLTAAAAMTASTSGSQSGTATLSAASTLTASGIRQQPGTASLSAASGLNAAGSTSGDIAVTLTAAGTLTVTVQLTALPGVVLSAASTLSATARLGTSAVVAMAAAGALISGAGSAPPPRAWAHNVTRRPVAGTVRRIA